MPRFRTRPGTKSATRTFRSPFPGIEAFDAVVRSLVMKNPLGCAAYRSARRFYPAIGIVREMYTAKFVYVNEKGRTVGIGIDRYDSVEGFQYGVAAVISNMGNVAAHRGKARHVPAADRFSVLMKCHDAGGEMFFVSLSRESITVASYEDDAILKRVGAWADTVPEMA